MPTHITTAGFEKELSTLKKQLSRYLTLRQPGKDKTRTAWFTSWLNDNSSWLRNNALIRGLNIADNPLITLEQEQTYQKSVLTTLLSNYESGRWYQRLVWWFQMPLSRLRALHAAYQLLAVMPQETQPVKELAPIKRSLETQLKKISAYSSLYGLFSDIHERIDYKIKYSFSNQLQEIFSSCKEALIQYGKKSKSFFSFQSNADLAQQLGLDNAQLRRRKQIELLGIPRKNTAQLKEQELLYYVLLQEGLENCITVLSHPLPDKASQELRWQQVVGSVVAMMKKGSQDLPASSTLGQLYRQLGNELNVLTNSNNVEVQLADYKKILIASITAEPPAVFPLQLDDVIPEEVKVLRLTPTKVGICLRLGIEGVSKDSQVVTLDAVRKRYKALCIALHPDRHPEEAAKIKATEDFKRLQSDYKLLLEQESSITDKFEQDFSEFRKEMERVDAQFQERFARSAALQREVEEKHEELSKKKDELIHMMRAQAKSVDELEQQSRNLDRRFKESDRLFDASDQRFKESDKLFDASDQRFKESDKLFDASDQKFRQAEKDFEEVRKKQEEQDKKLDELYKILLVRNQAQQTGNSTLAPTTVPPSVPAAASSEPEKSSLPEEKSDLSLRP